MIRVTVLEESTWLDSFKFSLVSWVQWLTLVIPTLWEAEVAGSQGQEFKTILANMVKCHLYKKSAGYCGVHL